MPVPKKTIIENINIRSAIDLDAHEISRLIITTSQACCFTKEQPCPTWFKESVSSTHIKTIINDKNIDWLVATIDNRIIGVLAISERSHVKYYFVKPSYHNQGIGRVLWKAASQKGIFGDQLTVRSSLNAVPVYERLGFVSVESPKTFEGLHYQTMVLQMANQPPQTGPQNDRTP